jgi:hypothetical protein
MLKLLQNRKARPVAVRTSNASTRSAIACPSSGFAFVDNSKGASAAIAELSERLGEALEEIELEGEHPNLNCVQ